MPAREKLDSGVADVDAERHAHSSQHETGQEKTGITRESLEEDARRMSQHDSSAADVFWGRQRGAWEVSIVGEADLLSHGWMDSNQVRYVVMGLSPDYQLLLYSLYSVLYIYTPRLLMFGVSERGEIDLSAASR
ncbi:hypothetical protein EMPG_12943 [Blastomyces silverae]|uniref:Uncharacterized protein n=1 Tax=Blastomyces silverae TaxID=2060906 RepID=A0A0H1BRZ0_9EURO|nr:hypothetical protein EMPG_12943 [Blastomyces silverae]